MEDPSDVEVGWPDTLVVRISTFISGGLLFIIPSREIFKATNRPEMAGVKVCATEVTPAP
jgi:hypothetical protein